MKVNPALKKSNFQPRWKLSPEKDIYPKTEKIYPHKMENREKVVFPMWWTYEENWTLSVMEIMASSNEGFVTIVGYWNLLSNLASNYCYSLFLDLRCRCQIFYYYLKIPYTLLELFLFSYKYFIKTNQQPIKDMLAYTQ
jgi:hypothetical protein